MEDAHDSNPDKVADCNLKYRDMNNPVTTYGFQQYDVEAKSVSVRNHVTGDGIADRNLLNSIGADYTDASSTGSEDPEDDGILPEKPEPIDESEMDITAETDILNWNGVNMNGHI